MLYYCLLLSHATFNTGKYHPSTSTNLNTVSICSVRRICCSLVDSVVRLMRLRKEKQHGLSKGLAAIAGIRTQPQKKLFVKSKDESNFFFLNLIMMLNTV